MNETKIIIKLGLTNKRAAKIGYHFARGVLNRLGLIFFIGFVIVSIAGLFLPTDSTDKDRFHRSGMRLRVDAATGINYLSDGNGGMCVRLTSEGTPFVSK